MDTINVVLSVELNGETTKSMHVIEDDGICRIYKKSAGKMPIYIWYSPVHGAEWHWDIKELLHIVREGLKEIGSGKVFASQFYQVMEGSKGKMLYM